jgi:hypothetical protein
VVFFCLNNLSHNFLHLNVISIGVSFQLSYNGEIWERVGILRSIGIRVAPKVVSFSICEKNENSDDVVILTIDKIIVPMALKTEKKLSYIRTTLLSIFAEYKIENAGIRITEATSMNTDIFRIYLEGVIQELLATCNIQKYFLGTLSNISRYLGESSDKIQEFIAGDDSLFGSNDIPKSRETRESVLIALSAVNL